MIDDQRAFAEAVTLALEMTDDLRVVCTAESVDDGYRAIETAQPDLIVTDFRLRGPGTGLDLAARVRSTPPSRLTDLARTPIVMLTGHPAPQVLRGAAALADLPVLSKDAPISEVVAAFRLAVRGRTPRSWSIDDPFGLTKAEMEVLEHLALGRNAAEIARELTLSVHAIRARIKGVLRKMGVTSQLEAVVVASATGLVVPPAMVPPDSVGGACSSASLVGAVS